MALLSGALLESVESGCPFHAALEALGEPEPTHAAKALHSAAHHPDLAATRAEWVPTLASSACLGLGARDEHRPKLHDGSIGQTSTP